MSDYEEDFESPAREGGSDAEEYASDDFEGGVPRRALARSAVLESTRSRSMGGSGAQLLASGRAVPAPKGMRSSMRIVTQQDLKRAAQAEEWKEAAWSKLYATQRTKRKSNRGASAPECALVGRAADQPTRVAATDTEASKKEYFDRVSKPKIRFEAGLALNCPLGQPEARLTRVHRRGGGLAKADDRRHCTFRPRISSKASEMVGEQQDFVGRMEAKEAEKRRALEQRRQREAYEARLDKKVRAALPLRLHVPATMTHWGTACLCAGVPALPSDADVRGVRGQQEALLHLQRRVPARAGVGACQRASACRCCVPSHRPPPPPLPLVPGRRAALVHQAAGGGGKEEAA